MYMYMNIGMQLEDSTMGVVCIYKLYIFPDFKQNNFCEEQWQLGEGYRGSVFQNLDTRLWILVDRIAVSELLNP